MAPSQRAATAVGSRLAPLPYAGLQLRIVAFILDVMVLISFGVLFAAGILAFLVFQTNQKGDATDIDFWISGFVLFFYLFLFIPLYFVLLWSWRGQTVGMMAVRIKLLSREGGPVSPGRSVLRLLFYPASVLPLLGGFIMALFDRERRTLHDLLAGTVVIELP